MEKENKTLQFKRNQQILNVIRFLAFPLGWAMYFLTVDAFGDIIASILCGIAALGFWLIINKGRDRLLYDALSVKIHEAISEVGPLDSQIEMKPFTGGLILRIFLLQPGNKIVLYNQAIYRKLSNWDITKKSWVVQITNVNSYKDIDKARTILDEELLEEIRKNKQGNSKDN